ncbi:MAG: pyridoxamine 5'-phosphate oxidase family protein [Marmoricola sp.]
MTLDLAALPPAVAQFWTERHLCTLTTLRADGSPHVTPVGVVLDPEQGCAWVITSRGSCKARNAAVEPRVATCQVDGRRWSTLEGIAEVRNDAEAVARAVERYAGRYRTPRPNPDRVAIRITPTRLLAGADLR